MAKVLAVNISRKKGVVEQIDKGYLKADYGLEGDIHSGNQHRQVSLLGQESIDRIKSAGIKGLCTDKFVPNINTIEIDLYKLQIGKKLMIGESVIEITQIGKECYIECDIKKLSKPCAMSKEVVFAKVIHSGFIKTGDEIKLI